MKALGEYNKHKEGEHGRKAACRACAALYNTTPERKAYDKTRRATSERKAYHRAFQRRRRTGFTPEDFTSRQAAQNGRCAICLGTLREGRGGAAADHCHDTQKIRGVLCSNCNRGVGKLKDNAVLLIQAAGYLVAHGQAYPTETLEAAIERHREVISRY